MKQEQQHSGPALKWAVVPLFLLSIGCTAGLTDQTLDAQRFNAEPIVVATCLVPGQIRQLSQHVTYLTARKPVTWQSGACMALGGMIEPSLND